MSRSRSRAISFSSGSLSGTGLITTRGMAFTLRDDVNGGRRSVCG
jgi:hypothetical protein